MELYATVDYRKYLAVIIKDNGSRGFHKSLATAAGCQASYLSKVLSEACHLTPEHAANISRFLNFSDLEGAYFRELVNFGRAGTAVLRKVLQARLDELRRQARELSVRVEAPAAKDEELVYYSNWVLSAIHLLSSVSEFQTTAALAAKLNATPKAIEHHCRTLKGIGLIDDENGRWVQKRSAIHAVRGTPAAFLHLNNWRQHAAQRSLYADSESIHFTGLYSLSKADAQHLRGELIKFIGDTSERVRSSPEENAVCMNIDFFGL